MERLKKYFKSVLEDLFLNTANRLCTQLRLFCIAAAGIACIMTALNLIKAEYVLGLETAVGAAVSILIYIHTEKSGKYRPGALCVAAVFLLLLTAFLVSGAVEGFAALWFGLYPFICLFILDSGTAAAFIAGGLAVLAAFLWTPLSTLLPGVYTQNFMLRFPLLYVGHIAFAAALNGFYSYTYNRLLQMNQKFESLSNQDGLTKLANRNRMEGYIRCLAEEKRAGVCAIMLDVDYFKQYNDTYGHLEGDDVLKKIAELLQEILGEMDALAVRYGGEEFLVLMPGRRKEEAEAFAEKIRCAVYGLHIPHTTAGGWVSVSVGVAYGDVKSEEDVTGLVGRADTALYCAKQSGRNRVSVARTDEIR